LPVARACATFSSTKVGRIVSPTYVPIHKLTDCVQDSKVVYRRYASLFFIAGCASDDNELITLEIVHRYVEQMDKYYGNVCELDIIFNFQKAYFILDELLLAGEMQESSKKNVLRCIGQQDSLEDMEVRTPFPTHSLSLHTFPFLSLRTFDAAFHPSPHRFRPPGICQHTLTLIQVEDEAVTRIM
jgi:hypothetical protein